jgi:predicted kinase
VRANSDEFAKPEYGLDSSLLKRLHSAQRRFICVAREVLGKRARDGRIVDGHGDLRPEHIYFAPSPRVIDCLEFSEELRTIDVADELAFLAMECDQLGATWVGEQILRTYCEINSDQVAPELVEFFKCYRACVRAKVNALRSRQVSESAAASLTETCNAYLRLADRSAVRLGPPLLLIVRGLSGTGKSTLAAALAESLACGWLQTDELRRQLFGPSKPAADFNSGQYSAENRRQVYESMFRLAEEHLSQGLSVVLDGTFLTAESRRRAIQLAQVHRSVPLLVTCTCPNNVAMERIRNRAAAETVKSDARPDFVDLQRDEEEPDDPAWPVCMVDTTEQLERICQTIFDRVLPLVLPGCAIHQKVIACDLSAGDDLATPHNHSEGIQP